MQIKKFEAVDMQEALRLIRNDIGPDAVILSTKKVKRGDGVFGMFSRQMVEVVAARDYPDKDQSQDSCGSSQGQGTVPYSPADVFPQNKSLMEDIQKIKTDISVTPVV